MRVSFVAAALLAASAQTSAQVYKCPDASGRTVLQQAPCTGGQQLEVRPATGFDNPDNARQARDRVGRAGSAQDILVAISEGRPAIGMNENELRMALGTPMRINRANYEGQTSDQWVYHSRGQSWYVYMRDGLVSSFQNSERSGSRQQRNCPNSMEIRNMETSASSTTISQQERRALQRQVAEAKACQ